MTQVTKAQNPNCMLRPSKLLTESHTDDEIWNPEKLTFRLLNIMRYVNVYDPNNAWFLETYNHVRETLLRQHPTQFREIESTLSPITSPIPLPGFIATFVPLVLYPVDLHTNIFTRMQEMMLEQNIRNQMLEYQRNQRARRVLTTPRPSDPNRPTESCPICLEDIKPREIPSATPCGHLFHPNCISRWLEERDTCPMCRQPCFE